VRQYLLKQLLQPQNWSSDRRALSITPPFFCAGNNMRWASMSTVSLCLILIPTEPVKGAKTKKKPDSPEDREPQRSFSVYSFQIGRQRFWCDRTSLVSQRIIRAKLRRSFI
jgi:hypothetical protein